LKKKLESSGQFPDINQNLKLDAPGYRIEMDRQKMAKLKLDSQPLAKALQVAFHQDQTLDFTKDGRLYAITLTNQNPAWSLSDVYVVNEAGKKIPASHFAQLVPSAEPSNLLHHNQMRSATLSSDLPEGMTLPQAMKAMEAQVREELPLDCKMEWVGNAKRFAQNQFSGLLLFVLAILFIYAILAMQFESWLDPWIILLTVPLACLGGLWAIQWAGGSFNIYSQIGLITLIGLITKHGILIVEFADQLAKIHPLKDAVIEAATLRLRPILMTAASTIAGALPLIFSGGDGHEAREAMGLVLVGGMLFGTIFTLWILPMALYGIKK
jgi:multidrug efflux pump